MNTSINYATFIIHKNDRKRGNKKIKTTYNDDNITYLNTENKRQATRNKELRNTHRINLYL